MRIDTAGIRNLAITMFFLVASAAVVNLWWNARLALQTVIPKVGTTLTMTSDAARQVAAMAQGFKQQQDEPQVIQARKNFQLASAAAAQHLTYVTLPKLDENLQELQQGLQAAQDLTKRGAVMVTNVDNTLNQQLLPEITQGVKDYGKLAGTLELVARGGEAQVAMVVAGMNELLRNGAISLDLINGKLQDPRLDELIALAVSTTRHIDATTNSIEQSAGELPPMFAFARKAQKPLTYLQVLAVLTRIFNPLRVN